MADKEASSAPAKSGGSGSSDGGGSEREAKRGADRGEDKIENEKYTPPQAVLGGLDANTISDLNKQIPGVTGREKEEAPPARSAERLPAQERMDAGPAAQQEPGAAREGGFLSRFMQDPVGALTGRPQSQAAAAERPKDMHYELGNVALNPPDPPEKTRDLENLLPASALAAAMEAGQSARGAGVQDMRTASEGANHAPKETEMAQSNRPSPGYDNLPA